MKESVLISSRMLLVTAIVLPLISACVTKLTDSPRDYISQEDFSDIDEDQVLFKINSAKIAARTTNKNESTTINSVGSAEEVNNLNNKLLYSLHDQYLGQNSVLKGKIVFELEYDISGMLKDVRIISSEVRNTRFLRKIRLRLLANNSNYIYVGKGKVVRNSYEHNSKSR